jgi:hypothetical protein
MTPRLAIVLMALMWTAPADAPRVWSDPGAALPEPRRGAPPGVATIANALSSGADIPVELLVRGRGRVLGRLTTSLGTAPAPVAIPLSAAGRRTVRRHVSTPAAVTLLQNGARLAQAKVRID